MQSGVDAGGPAITRGSHAVTNELSVDYDAVVSGTVDEVKERVERDDLDAENVLEAERAGRDRSTLVEWLERRVSEPSPSDETEQ